MQETNKKAIFQRIWTGIKSLSWTAIILNLLIILVVIIVGVFLVNMQLKNVTLHNQEILVPKVSDLDGKEAIQVLQDSDLKFDISDSTYFPDLPPFYVIEQNPVPGQSVKKGRTVYLKINATTPPMIAIPKVSGISEMNAIARLRNAGFDVDENEIVYEPYMYNKAALFVEIKGSIIQEGYEYPKGTEVILHVGDGLGSDLTPIPSIIGLSPEEARFVLKERGLSLDNLYFDSSIRTAEDSLNAVIYKQDPTPSTLEEDWVSKKTPVDIYLIKEELFDESAFK